MSTLLEVSGVSVSFDGFKAINNLSFQIAEAELRAVIGPNGAGKTTFMDIVTGKTRPDEGRVIWGEKSVSLLDMDEAQIARQGIGRKFQKPTVFEDQTVRDNLMMALKKDRWVIAVLLFRASSADNARVEELAAEVGLSDQLDRIAGELSHGQKQWLEIGMLLAQEPRLLLPDEPTARMARADTNNTIDLLKQISDERDITIAIIEHDMHVVFSLANRITVLAQGTPLVEDDPENIKGNPKVREAYLGETA